MAQGQSHSGHGGSVAGPPVKFFLLFDVKDESGESLKKAVTGLHDLSRAGEEAAESAEHAGHRVHSLVESFEHLEHAGHQIAQVGERVVGTLEEWAHEGLHVAAEFDTLHAKMIFAFRDGADQAFENLQLFEQNSSYSLAEVTEAVATLTSAFREINPTDLTRRFRSSTGEMQDGLTALSDAAVGAGVSLGDTVQIVERALEGNFRSIQYQMRLSSSEVARMRSEIGRAHGDQEKYNAVVQTLATHWGGAQAAMGQTFDQLTLRIHSMKEQVLGTIFAPMRDELKPLLKMFHDFLVELRNGEEEGHAIGDSLAFVAKILVWVGKAAINGARAIMHFVREYPILVKMGVVLAAVAGGLVTVIGSAIALVGSVGAAAAAFISVWPQIVAAWGAISTAFAGAVPYITLLIAGAALLKLAWTRDFAGIRTFIEHVVLVVRALWEAFHNWGEETATISKETADNLEDAGILTFFVRLVSWLKRAELWGRGVWDSLKKGWERVGPVLRAAWTQLTGSFRHLSDVLSRTFSRVQGLGTSVGTTLETARDKGNRFGEILNRFVLPTIRAFAAVLRAIAWVVEHIVIPVMSTLVRWFQDASVWVQNHSDVVRIALEALAVVMGYLAVQGIGVLVTAIAGLAAGAVAALPGLVAFIAPFLTAAAPILATVAAIVAVVEAIRQVLNLIEELNRQDFRETWRLITHGGPDLDSIRTNQRGVHPAGAPPATPTPPAAGPQPVLQGVPPTSAGLTPSTSPPTTPGPAAGGDGSGTAEGGDAAAAQTRILREISTMMGRLHGATQDQNQMLRSGALRPVISEGAIANAVENHNAQDGERRGYINRGGT